VLAVVATDATFTEVVGVHFVICLLESQCHFAPRFSGDTVEVNYLVVIFYVGKLQGVGLSALIHRTR
jgi:hypothetical protein